MGRGEPKGGGFGLCVGFEWFGYDEEGDGGLD